MTPLRPLVSTTTGRELFRLGSASVLRRAEKGEIVFLWDERKDPKFLLRRMTDAMLSAFTELSGGSDGYF